MKTGSWTQLIENL